VREQLKQVLKNSVYRAIGETAKSIGAVNGDERSLRVLMYHKVNDVPNNRMSMPVGLFDEQMAQLKELGYVVVDLDAVLDHYTHGARLAAGAVLITFDDGYRDNLLNAAPVLHKHGYSAVQFVPIAYVGDRQPLPHEEHLAANGVLNPTVDWGEIAELERRGGARDHDLEAAARGQARPAGARVLVRQGLGGALQAGASQSRPPGGL
jgi:hypothetical protein